MDKELLVKALKEALEKAKEINKEDNGTCNFDTCVLYIKGARLSVIEECCKKANPQLKVSKWSPGEFHIHGYERGQAWLRTSMVEAFTDVLKGYGFDAFVYYCMD